MENMFFKLGVVIVGVMVTVLMIAFAFQSLSSTVRVPVEESDRLEGTASEIVVQIDSLCLSCIKEKVDRDCFIREVYPTEEITPGHMQGTPLDRALEPGKNVIKIKSVSGECMVTRLV